MKTKIITSSTEKIITHDPDLLLNTIAWKGEEIFGFPIRYPRTLTNSKLEIEDLRGHKFTVRLRKMPERK